MYVHVDDGRRRGGKGQWTHGGSRNGNARPAGDRPKPSAPALWVAVEAGNLRGVLELLSDEQVDVDERYQGWTPLMKAAEEGHCDIAKLLLNKGANINAVNRKGRSALSFAAAPSMNGSTPRQEDINMVRLLAEKGANLFLKDQNGQTAKGHANKEKRSLAVLVLQRLEAST